MESFPSHSLSLFANVTPPAPIAIQSSFHETMAVANIPLFNSHFLLRGRHRASTFHCPALAPPLKVLLPTTLWSTDPILPLIVVGMLAVYRRKNLAEVRRRRKSWPEAPNARSP